MRRGSLVGLRQAFDEARFGAARTLNLRESLPTANAARIRAEAWLRQRQVEKSDQVLIITGRGNQSEGGVSVVRETILRLLHTLKRRGVVAGHEEHTAGSFVVTLAPVQALWESPPRNRGRGVASPPRTPPSLDALDDATHEMLRELAQRSLEGLGIKETDDFLEGEMLRQLGAIAATIPASADRVRRLRAAVRAALEQYE